MIDLTRRRLLTSAGTGLGTLALETLLRGSLAPKSANAATTAAARAIDFPAKAKRAIWLFMEGGPSHLDLFDYKPGLADRFNQDVPASVLGSQRVTTMTSMMGRFPVAPSAFPFKQYGQSGAWVSELLPWTAKLVDDITIIKTMQTDAINHDPAMAAIMTGSQIAGKPSVGAWLSYGLGSLNQNLPTFVVMTSRFTPHASVQALSARLWGSAFLPSSHAGVPLRSVGDPVLYLANPPGMSTGVRRSILDTTKALNNVQARRVGDPEVLSRIEQYEMAFRMQSAVPELTDLSGESSTTKDLYGPDVNTPGTFASNCLMARRMLERDVRFVQIFHRGWDSHLELPARHRIQCLDVDQACYGLVTDLKQRGLLEDTLVIWGGEFGRGVYSQGTLTATDYGRDHHGLCFSMWAAGAGLKPGIVYGETDDYGYNVVQNPVPVRDLHATLLHQFGIDHNKLVVPYQGLAQKLVGVGPPAAVATGVLSE
jgi:hypothetical protein